MNRRVLVTGAGGFVGGHLCAWLTQRGHEVVAHGRTTESLSGVACTQKLTGDLSTQDWSALSDIDAIVHLAARSAPRGDGDALVFEADVAATRRLAESARNQQIRAFVFLSSVKVNGETTPTRPFRADDTPAPEDSYARTKLRAEQALAETLRHGPTKLFVLRPPMVYGAEVQGNFARLVALLQSGIPLPFAGVRNRRDLIAVDNLVDLIGACLGPEATPGTYLASDDNTMSIRELCQTIGRHLGAPARLFNLGHALPHLMLSLPGLVAIRRRLVESLELDCESTHAVLGWTPPHTMEAVLGRMTGTSQQPAEYNPEGP